MTTTREIAGIEFACDKLPGDEGLALFLRTSAALRSARGCSRQSRNRRKRVGSSMNSSSSLATWILR